MRRLSIPDDDMETMNYFTVLPSETKEQILNELRQMDLNMIPDNQIAHLSKKVQGVGLNRINDLIKILFSLLRTQKTFEVDDTTFAEMLQYEFSKSKKFGKTSVSEVLQFMSAYRKVYNGFLQINDLYNKNERLFSNVSIKTDIQPLFLENEQKLSKAVIIHNLIIEYRENDQTHKMHFSLDTDDLIELRKAIDTEEKRLKEIKKTINLNLIELK